jgi:signal transduction histidine kinase
VSSAFKRRPRGVVVAVLLVTTLGLTGLLAYQAVVAASEHRATAERVLRDYASFAATRLAQRTGQELYYGGFGPALDALDHARAVAHNRVLVAPARLAQQGDSMAHDAIKRLAFTFDLDLRTGRLEVSGAMPPTAVRRWITDTLTAFIHRVHRKDWPVAGVLGTTGGTRYMLFYRLDRDPQGVPRDALGFAGDLASLMPLFKDAAEKMSLLPPALTGGVALDSLGSAIIRDAAGQEIYRTPVQYQSAFTGHDTLSTMLVGLQVSVALRADRASALVIGGLPRSRLPLIFGLLVITAVLVGAALVQLRREYQLASLRSDFVSSVSHELRTPLAQIRMFSETLLLGRVRSEAERNRSLAIVDQEARRLTHLVENLLHFSRSERQATRITPEPTPIAPLIRSAIERFEPLAAARRVTVRTVLDPDVVIPVDADALHQMLLNLLDNAVKYGPDGQTVTVGLRRNGEKVRIWVEDLGPGVPADARARVWERFWRLERDRDSAVAGTGIGLAVVRELSSLHRGRSWCEEADAGGARFVIELPMSSGNGGTHPAGATA